MESVHKTVLLKETIDGLNLPASAQSGDSKKVVIDATFGGGGHALQVCKNYPDIKIIAIDQDRSAIERGKEKMSGCNVTFLNQNFRELGDLQADAIIFDLGLSSDQLENSGRGFSFQKDEPLLMTMKSNPSEEYLTAKEIVNTWEEKNLADIIYGYGEEKFSRRIAKAITEARDKAEIKTTFDLVKIIERAVGRAYKRQKMHCATRTFQAIRIAVNDELGSLQEGLRKGFDSLNPGGRMAVISFHSLEDRIVKRFYSAKGGSASGGQGNREAKIITKKPITPSTEEIKNNPRARSAKLRIIQKT
ncbi:16S rRNA (cytosine(1402)-N(4))-methyltransferase RsmH [Candidatus Nomurabacteria bacterium]|nr:16S rRNA (cytosine(1402)-N(4))-methyltransferase RsmH [Candidatus Nomurabacteria bacterium]